MIIEFKSVFVPKFKSINKYNSSGLILDEKTEIVGNPGTFFPLKESNVKLR